MPSNATARRAACGSQCGGWRGVTPFTTAVLTRFPNHDGQKNNLCGDWLLAGDFINAARYLDAEKLEQRGHGGGIAGVFQFLLILHK